MGVEKFPIFDNPMQLRKIKAIFETKPDVFRAFWFPICLRTIEANFGTKPDVFVYLLVYISYSFPGEASTHPGLVVGQMAVNDVLSSVLGQMARWARLNEKPDGTPDGKIPRWIFNG